MTVKAIVLQSMDGVIAVEGKLPYNFKEDMNSFKALTMGEIVIMGSKTWDGLYKQPLPGRVNVVMSKSRVGTDCPGAVVVNSIGAVHEFCALHQVKELWVIGGAELYKLFDIVIDEWYITIVHEIMAHSEGLRIPPLDKKIWKCDFARPATTFPGTFKHFVRRT